MNGPQVEYMMRLIEGNISLTREEAANYIRENEELITTSLIETGRAILKTTAGDIVIKLEDLEAVDREAVTA